MPALVVVADHLWLDGVQQKHGVQPVHGGLIVARRCRGEYRAELRPKVLEHGKIAP